MPELKTKVTCKVFRGSGDMTWDRLLASAAEFANTLTAERILSISHASDGGNGTVVIWYFEEAL